MKEFTITIKLDTDSEYRPDVEALIAEGTLNQVFTDALSDFRNIRGRSGEYVERQYPRYSDEQKEKKADQVAQRARAAMQLHNAVIAMEIEDTTPEPCSYCGVAEGFEEPYGGGGGYQFCVSCGEYQ